MERGLLGFRGLKEVPNIHPVFVHFPIALFPVTLLFYVLGIFGKRPDYLTAGKLCLYLAAASGILTAMTGLKARSSVKFNETLGKMVKTHQSIGISIFMFSAVLVIWSFFQENNKPKGDIPFLVALAFATFLSMQNADIGSLMVYTQGAGVKSKTNESDLKKD